MAASDQFSLRWNKFYSNLTTGFHDLLREESLVDVTLAVEGRFLQAHRVLLSICSPFFRNIFKVNPCKHPVVILTNVKFDDMRDILTFIYQGEVNVRQQDLQAFLKTAEVLQIKGLTGDESAEDMHDMPDHMSDHNSIDENVAYQNKMAARTPLEQFEAFQQQPLRVAADSPAMEVPPARKSVMNYRSPSNSPFPNTTTTTKRAKVDGQDQNVTNGVNERDNTKLNDESEMSDSEYPYAIKPEAEDYMQQYMMQQSTNTSKLIAAALLAAPDGIKNEINGTESFYSGRQQYFECPVCYKKFVNRYNMKVHIRDKHQAEQRSAILTCTICGKIMRNQSCLRVHLYNHRKQLQNGAQQNGVVVQNGSAQNYAKVNGTGKEANSILINTLKSDRAELVNTTI